MNRSECHKTCRPGAYMLDTHILFFSKFLQFFLDVYLVKKSMCWHCEVFRAWECKLQAWSLCSHALTTHRRPLFLLKSVSTLPWTLLEHLYTCEAHIAFFPELSSFFLSVYCWYHKKKYFPGVMVFPRHPITKKISVALSCSHIGHVWVELGCLMMYRVNMKL